MSLPQEAFVPILVLKDFLCSLVYFCLLKMPCWETGSGFTIHWCSLKKWRLFCFSVLQSMKYFSKKKENLTWGFIVIWDLKDKVNVELLNLVCGQKKAPRKWNNDTTIYTFALGDIKKVNTKGVVLSKQKGDFWQLAIKLPFDSVLYLHVRWYISCHMYQENDKCPHSLSMQIALYLWLQH